MRQNAILEHYKKNWKVIPNIYLWDKGPIEKLPSDFRILEFPPGEIHDMWTYATCCMSQQSDKLPIELHIFSSNQDTCLIELLTMVAYYHRTHIPIGLNHTVNFGKGWKDSSICNHGFISLPYLDGPDLENLVINPKNIIKFYWLIPVTENEVDFKKEYGAEALEEKLEKGINYLDALRKSLA